MIGHALAAADRAVGRLPHDRIQLELLNVLVRSGAARELEHIADQLGEVVELGQDRVLQLLLILRRQLVGLEEDLDVRAQRRDRGSQLMRGIRDQVALRFDRALECGERLVEAGGEAADLDRALLIEPARAGRASS